MQDAVQVAVARVLEAAEQRPLDDPRGGGCREEHAGPRRRRYAAVRRHEYARCDAHPRPVVLELENLSRPGAGLNVAHERGIDHRPRADHEAKRAVGRGAHRRGRAERHADARVGGRCRPDQRQALDPRPLEHEDGADEERDTRHRARRVAGLRDHERLADGTRHEPMRGSTSRSARSMSSGKSISVQGIPSTRSKPTATRASRSG